MSDAEKTLNYAELRTKMAAQRTLMVLLVGIKVFIILAAKKHNVYGLFFGILLLLMIGYQYYHIVSEINNKNEVHNQLIDYYILILIPVLLGMSALSWIYRKD
ncbi:MAG: hypothetical protein CML42_07855 [Rhodobacteraceae bacterium]|nr:hypothetical protein [Paracoccaceae bacterium]|tara:strand:+ start:37618 stop:37926 length:309 start_codon:yes stop_codon:yes gene_type:complete